MTPAPAGQTPGSVLIRAEIRCACALSAAQISCGIEGSNRDASSQGAVYSTFGIARISRLTFGVAPCQARGSRKTPAPAGAPTRVERRIHSGSSAWVGGAAGQGLGAGDLADGPFSTVRSLIRKLIGDPGRRALEDQMTRAIGQAVAVRRPCAARPPCAAPAPGARAAARRSRACRSAASGTRSRRQAEVAAGADHPVVVAAEQRGQDRRGGRQVDHRRPLRLVQQLARRRGGAVAVAVRQPAGLGDVLAAVDARDVEDLPSTRALASRMIASVAGSSRSRTTTKPSRRKMRFARSISSGPTISRPRRPLSRRRCSRSATTSGSS